MSQTKNPRRVNANEARVKLVSIRISPQKLNLVAASIRGLKVQRALNELEFSRKRIAKDVRKALYSAISNAENNHNLDIDNLIVAESYVGKGIVMKRFASRARGRSSRIIKPFSELTIVVRELGAESQVAAYWVRKLIRSVCASASTVPGTRAGSPRVRNMPSCFIRT
jgi:large subunit ribosomal protein L22